MDGIITAAGLLVTDAEGALPIVLAEEPNAPEGYTARCSWREASGTIQQVWELVPVEGTAEEAALKLARMQAESLPDEQAALVPALYDEWSGGAVGYKDGDRRRYKGKLYRCLQAHTSQPAWTPVDAPSLWAEVLPGQDGNEPEEGYAEWVQPDSTNPYRTGDRVTHEGHLWESTHDANVWEPGAVGAPWTDLGEYPGETE